MKKLFLFLSLMFVTLMAAQTEQGKFMLETSVISNNTVPNTGLGYTSEKDGVKVFNIGMNGGYFVQDNLALKVGVGYGNTRYDGNTTSEVFSYRVGLEYHLVGYVPIEVAWAGSDVSYLNENPSYLSTQLGYNWFFTNHVGIKPLIRYDISLMNNYKDLLSIGVGFNYYF